MKICIFIFIETDNFSLIEQHHQNASNKTLKNKFLYNLQSLIRENIIFKTCLFFFFFLIFELTCYPLFSHKLFTYSKLTTL